MPDIDPSLVTIEVAERLAVRAAVAIAEGRTEDAGFLLIALVDETTMRTASAVKDQAVSDEISRQAAIVVRTVMTRLSDEQALRVAEAKA